MNETIDTRAFVEFERTGWDRIPSGYHRFLGPVTVRLAEPLLDAAGVEAGSRVVDVATGPGYVAGRAAARDAEVVGVDLSPGILQLACALHPDVTFVEADAHDLPFPDASASAVVAGFLLPHLADHHRAVGEFARILAPGGRVALSTWDEPERVPLLGAVVEAVAAVGVQAPPSVPTGPPFFAYSSDTALEGLLRHAGLVDVEVATVAFAHRVASPGELWDGVLDGSVRTSALVRAQPAAVQGEIRAAFDRIVQRYAVSGGGLELPVSVKLAAARRG